MTALFGFTFECVIRRSISSEYEIPYAADKDSSKSGIYVKELCAALRYTFTMLLYKVKHDPAFSM